MIYSCCDDTRGESIRTHATLNGIDFLEVLDDPSLPDAQRQRTLLVYFLNTNHLADLQKENVFIEGGERIRGITVENVSTGGGGEAKVLTVEVDRPGDFSIYTLRLVQDGTHSEPPDGFDRLLSEVDFSFKVECPSDFDCRADRVCPPQVDPALEIDYLAKDYASFRQLMLDRMALLLPAWSERNPADVGIALVELLAYVGDHLSYQQDAVTTEAYLGTARRRTSVRRHARLVDYFMHDGASARVWVQVRVTADDVWLPKGSQLLTCVAGLPRLIPPPPNSPVYERAIAARPEVFETMHDAALFAAHNEMSFYTWEGSDCCLPKGATRGTLSGHVPNLKAGDVLIFQEVLNPRTKTEQDADPAHRHAVRLNDVRASGNDGKPLTDPLNGQQITEIAWQLDDALPFPLCVSTKAEAAGADDQDASVVLGNIVLADHGRTIGPELLGQAPEPRLEFVLPTAGDRCRPPPPKTIPPRFRPRLQERSLSFPVPLQQQLLFGLDFQSQHQTDLDNHQFSSALQQRFAASEIAFHKDSIAVQGHAGQWSISDGTQAYVIRKEELRLNVYELSPAASPSLCTDPSKALPAIVRLLSQQSGKTLEWTPRRDLLDSAGDQPDFVVELEADGTAYLRFGDNQHGLRPEPGSQFTAFYRVGSALRGNIGADSLQHVVTTDPRIAAISNPLAARGGVEPESMERVRQSAPSAFRWQQRAVTAADYAEVGERHPEVQRAAATFRWTGSWQTVFLTVDRLRGLPVDGDFKREMQQHMEAFRMAGYDLEVDGPRFVSLEIEMQVCVRPEYFRSSVKAALLEVFGSGKLLDGRRGVFHPDNFSFGRPDFLSRLIAAAQAVAGVESVRVTKFQRQGEPSSSATQSGRLAIGRLEIARLDNDPNFPERGLFRLLLGGGK